MWTQAQRGGNCQRLPLHLWQWRLRQARPWIHYQQEDSRKGFRIYKAGRTGRQLLTYMYIHHSPGMMTSAGQVLYNSKLSIDIQELPPGF